MSHFHEARLLANTLAPRMSDEKREACRAKLLGLREAVFVCDEFIKDCKSDPDVSADQMLIAQAIRDLIQETHDLLEMMADGGQAAKPRQPEDEA